MIGLKGKVEADQRPGEVGGEPGMEACPQLLPLGPLSPLQNQALLFLRQPPRGSKVLV